MRFDGWLGVTLMLAAAPSGPEGAVATGVHRPRTLMRREGAIQALLKEAVALRLDR